MVFVPCKWFTNKIIQVSMILFSDALNYSPCVPFFDFVCCLLSIVCCRSAFSPVFYTNNNDCHDNN